MKLKITVHGVSYEVDVEVLDAGDGFPQATHPRPRSRQQRTETESHASPPTKATAPSSGTSEGGSVTSPIAGTVIELKCKAGDEVKNGQILLVIEAMKMKTSIAAPTSGKIKNIPVAVGDSVREGQTLVEFE